VEPYEVGEILNKAATEQRLRPGWVAWVGSAQLATKDDKPGRPWVRGKTRDGMSIEWFPRSSKPPREGMRWAVYSSAGQLPRFTRQGWYIANAFRRRDATYVPEGDEYGVLPPTVVEEIYKRLDNFYWDSKG
jgi:hypothetical protein